MDIYRIKDCDECMLGALSDIGTVLLIVIEDSGVDSFSTGSALVNVVPLIRTIRNRKIISGTIESLHISSLTVI